MKSKRFSKGRFIGEYNEFFTEGKVYRGKFDVYERFVLFSYQSKVYKSSPANWEFKEEWEVKND